MIPAYHAGDPGSIPGRCVLLATHYAFWINVHTEIKVTPVGIEPTTIQTRVRHATTALMCHLLLGNSPATYLLKTHAGRAGSKNMDGRVTRLMRVGA